VPAHLDVVGWAINRVEKTNHLSAVDDVDLMLLSVMAKTEFSKLSEKLKATAQAAVLSRTSGAGKARAKAASGTAYKAPNPNLGDECCA
jgi:hypothetical protein